MLARLWCVCVRAHVHMECPSDRQSFDVRVLQLSLRWCQDGLDLLGNWEVVISREAFLCSGYTTALVKPS